MKHNVVSVTVAALACLLLGACGPDLGSIDLSTCMRDCNGGAKSCLDGTNDRLDRCGDAVCQRSAVDDSERCLTSCLSCISDCVAAMEQTLKK